MPTFPPGMTRAGAAFAVLLPGLTVPVAAAEEPPAEPVGIEVLSQTGAGCPPGTMSISMLPDNTAFRVDHTDFRAVTGGGAGVTEFRKQCLLMLVLHPPEGFSYALVRRDNRGRAHVEPGRRATFRSNHYYSPSTVSHLDVTWLDGPFDGEWQSTYPVEPANQIFVPCGEERTFHLNTEVSVTAGAATDPPSWISMQSSDAQAQALYQLEWRRC